MAEALGAVEAVVDAVATVAVCAGAAVSTGFGGSGVAVSAGLVSTVAGGGGCWLLMYM
ncbi:MAG: hypothetical protein WKG00_06940 [Polyangiaceae bacterium]